MSDAESNEAPLQEGVTLAGHAPAVKVSGGVRITQNKPRRESEGKGAKKEEEEEEQEKPNPNEHDQRILISGVVTKGDKDFPPEAVKSFHEKPAPAHQQPHVPKQRANIQQPRK